MSYKAMSNVFITRLLYYKRTLFAADISFNIVMCVVSVTFQRNTQKEERIVWEEH